MDPVSVFDAKNKLSALLDLVERGQEIVITRRGKAIARLVPVENDRAQTAAEKLRALRSEIAAAGETLSWSEIRDYRDEGRR